MLKSSYLWFGRKLTFYKKNMRVYLFRGKTVIISILIVECIKFSLVKKEINFLLK